MKKLTKDEFLEKANSVHNFKYDYSNTVYSGVSGKIIIICKKHGSFYQSANNHKSGKGCAKCSRSTMNYRKDGYVEMCKEKYGSLSNIYLLKIIDNNGAVFFKIGITVQKIENRFSKSCMPYDYEVLRFIKSDADAVFSAEMKIKSMVMRDRYEPLIKFSGSKYECFSTMTCGISKILDSLEVDLSA